MKYILMVEDESAHAGLIRHAFAKFEQEYTLLTAHTLVEARTQKAQRRPDLVLADYRLPDGEGSELIQWDDGMYPVVLMTASGDEHLAVQVIKAGALDYIVKSPEAFSVLPHTVARALREWDLITERKQMEEAQSFLLQCGWSDSGEDFFQSLARYLAVTLGMDYVCIDRLAGDRLSARTVAIFNQGRFEDNVEYTLKETPCGDVVGKTICCFPSGVRTQFPQDLVLQEMGAESYVGTTLWSSTGQPIGLIAVIGNHPIENSRLAESLLKLVAVRAAGELERRQAEAALRESEKKYRAVVENANEAIYVAQDGTIPFANQASCLMSGYSLEELRSRPLIEFAHPEDRERIYNLHLRHINGESIPTTNQTRIVTKDGSIRWIEIRAVLFEWEGRPATLNFAADITERKRAEEAVRESHAAMLAIFDNVDEPIYVADPTTYEILFINRVIEERFGVLNHRKCYEYLQHRETPCLFCTNDKILGEYLGRSYVWEFQNEVNNRCYKCIDKAIPWPDGRMVRYEMAIDITDLKQAEEALRQGEETFRSYVENSPIGIYVCDHQGNFVEVNQAACNDTGYRTEELKGMNILDLYTPENRSVALAHFQSVFDGKKISFEIPFIRKDARQRYWRIDAILLSENRVMGFAVDITERKQAEDRMRTMVEMLNVAPSSITIHDTDGRFLYANRKTFALHGYEDREFMTINLHELDVPESEALLAERFQRIKEHGEDSFEVDHFRKDGTTFPLEVFAKMVTWAGRPAVLSIATDITERKRAEEELLRRENQLQKIFEILPIGLWFADKNGLLLRGNPMGIQIWGAEPHVPISEYGVFKAWRLPSHEPVEADDWALVKTIRHKITIVDELLEIESFDGTRKTILNYTAPVLDGDGNVDGAIVVNLDISDRKNLEEQIRQAQKMESVGRLAGGVAHDFNNMLGVILGHTELAMNELRPIEPLYANLQEIQKAARRSADLTRQLLAFARKQMVDPKVLNLNDAVADVLMMLRRLIGENIDLIWIPSPDLWKIKIDISQIDQILANLAVNARDAIQGVGKVTIQTKNCIFDNAYCANHVGFLPGEYVHLAVSDTGCGMDVDTLAHIFEPFFTTKDVGEGTGLGLATVYGAVKQNGGLITVYSEPGKGTIFKLYFPRFKSEVIPSSKDPSGQQRIRGGTETILLVEDEEMILKLGQQILEGLGYTVLVANTPSEALFQTEDYLGDIHLLITDVIMPEMNGRELQKCIATLKPSIQCIFMSGYTADVIAHHGIIEEGMNFIQKPFSMNALAEKVREVLER